MIRNYTSEVSADKSVLKIEKRLVDAGAKNIMKLYDADKHLTGVAFIVTVNGKELPFKLPARIDRVEKALSKDMKRFVKGTKERIKLQAERTAWKIVSEWVDIQMSLVELDQAEMIEVFMPYLYDPRKDATFFDKWKESGLALLTDKTGHGMSA